MKWLACTKDSNFGKGEADYVRKVRAEVPQDFPLQATAREALDDLRKVYAYAGTAPPEMFTLWLFTDDEVPLWKIPAEEALKDE